jgi:hypothetical protein
LRLQAEADEKEREALMRGDIRYTSGYDPTTELSTQMNPADAYYSTQLDPRTVAANQRTAQNVYTQRDANNLNRQVFDPTYQALGQSGFSPEEQAYQQSALLKSVPETSYQQLIDRSGGNNRYGGGINQEVLLNRAELIKKIKTGIKTSDPTSLNLLKLIPGVEDVMYVNTGDEVGLKVYYRGQGQPTYIDLSEGGGEADINALLNRIEGQKNVPNELVFNMDTKVQIPKSNAREKIDEVKTSIAAYPQNANALGGILPKLKELAASQSLMMPDGSVVKSIKPNKTWWGPNEVIIEYHPTDAKGNIQYNKTKEMAISDPLELGEFIEINGNTIAPAFGGGFITGDEPEPITEEERQKFNSQFGVASQFGQPAQAPKIVNQGGKKAY